VSWHIPPEALAALAGQFEQLSLTVNRWSAGGAARAARSIAPKGNRRCKRLCVAPTADGTLWFCSWLKPCP